MKIGRLKVFEWEKKALTPIKPVAIELKKLGFNIVWSDKDDTVNYINNSAVFSIINRITRTASNAPFKVYRVKDRKKLAKYKGWTGENATKESVQRAMLIKEQVFTEDNNHPLNELIDRPNGFQRAAEFTANSIGYKLLTGNRFWFLNLLEMGVNAGRPFSIENLPPQHLSITGDGTLFGIKEYIFNLGTVTTIPKSNILHSKYWNPEIDTAGTHLYGLSPLKAAAKNIQRMNDGVDRSVAMLQNAGGAGLLYSKSETEMTMEQAQDLKRRVNQEVLGLDNAGKIALANGDMGYINFGLSAVDMQILEMEKYSLQQLCNIYGVPYVLFSSDSSTYNNIQEAKKELITMAVMPELASLRDDWNEIAKFYKDQDLYVDFDISVYPELQEDLEKTARIMTSSWWIKPNEKRLAMNLDEDTDNELMNDYIIPSGFQKLSDLNSLDNELDNVIEDDGDDVVPGR